jgi:hypothetical protein
VTPPTPLHTAAEDLAVAAAQLRMEARRAVVGGHPLHPALERLALATLRAAAAAVLEVAAFIAEETARDEREGDRP